MKRSKGRGTNIKMGGAMVNKIASGLILFSLVTSAYGQAFIVRPAGTAIENGKHYLKMQVWNCTNKDVEVHLADLPWGQYRLGLVLYPGGKLAGEPLKESMPVGDSPGTEIKIPAKSHVDGEIVLDQRFFDIDRYQERGNLLIFWEYDVSLITGGKPQIVGGMLPLDGESPSRKPSQAGCGSVR
jgi:hypothetical protein